tara:strand:+ start:568 stop:918 length:351 start_codon:yes stop_codon:yes gene_type:complete
MTTIESILMEQDTIDFIEAISITFKNISSEKIIDILPKIIAYVQKFKKLSLDHKKALIIQILNVIIDKTDGPGDDEIFDPILKRLVPILIDTFIKIENKELKFKQPNCLGKCLSKC